MIFGSLFSGIEAASAAWRPLGWRCAWTADIDPFASAVLKHRYPDVPNLGDVNEIDTDAVEPVDLIIFGSPCQSFSVAGKRLGLDDPRGNMALVGLRVVGRIRPRWVVWENVPGVLSSDGGRDFGAFLGLLGELGYGFAYRVLDAQFAGVPQRRRRVFVVGYLGDWRPAAAVLFEPESLRGDSPPRRATGKGVARPLASCSEGGSGYRYDLDDGVIAVAGTIGAENVRHTTGMESGADLLVPIQNATRGQDQNGLGVGGDAMFTLDGASQHAVGLPMSVRRLTPVECERLMGLPDNYTLIEYRGKPAADGNRYRAIGNSMAVPVVRWIGERIAAFGAMEILAAEAAD